jgi:hypothetical protein
VAEHQHTGLIISALRRVWNKTVARSRKPPVLPAGHRDFQNAKISTDLSALMDVLGVVQTRIVANSFLRAWIHWCNWTLIGLILFAAFHTQLAGSLAFAVALLASLTFGIWAWTWRNRMRPYECACLLDTRAGLQDRLSTSLWFGEEAHPEGFLLYQRKDALRHLPNLDVRFLFPIRFPELARRTLLMALIAGGLFVYRVYRPAPLTALLEKTWRSRLVQSLFSPRTPPVTNGAQHVKESPDQQAQASERRHSSDAADISANAWHDVDQDKPGLPTNQQPHDSFALRPPNSMNANQSLAQSFMQALKNMVSGQPEQDASSDTAPQQSPQRQDSSQPKNVSQNGAGNTSNQSGNESPRDSQQNGAQHIAGAGGQQRLPPNEPVKTSRPVVTPVVERVELEAKIFKDQRRMPVEPETGSSELGSGNVSVRKTAPTGGAQQQNIPDRYRSYVQRYFEHVRKGQ